MFKRENTFFFLGVNEDGDLDFRGRKEFFGFECGVWDFVVVIACFLFCCVGLFVKGIREYFILRYWFNWLINVKRFLIDKYLLSIFWVGSRGIYRDE